MNDSTQTASQRLLDYRESAGLSQRELATAAGIAQVTICRLENGTAPTPSIAGKVCSALSEALGFRVYTWEVFPGHFKDVRGGAA